MVIDGKEIAAEIKERLKEEVKKRAIAPTLFIFSVGENPVSEKFLAIKKKFASDIGVRIREKKFDENVQTKKILQEIEVVVASGEGSIIVQLPLPPHIDTERVLNVVPPERDPDVLSEKSIALFEKDTSAILPPVLGAIKEILLRSGVFVGNKKVVIVGRGKLVGAPAAVWFKRHGSNVALLGRDTADLKPHTAEADIIVLGVGSPGLLRPDMIKPEAVILDAGTSEEGGKLLGDADSACAEKAGVFTPVPGGIGPITVAILFQNLLTLSKP